MKEFFSEIRGAVVSTLVLAVVCCGLYPLIVFGISQALFHDKANGSLIVDQDGTVRGSKLLGQGFAADEIFSSAPFSRRQRLRRRQFQRQQSRADFAKAERRDQRTHCGVSQGERLEGNRSVPADAVTASGSGLDPHISLRNAELQTARVAKARGFSEEKVRELVQQYTDARDLGVFGDPGVNVLQLNLALDQAQSRPR